MIACPAGQDLHTLARIPSHAVRRTRSSTHNAPPPSKPAPLATLRGDTAPLQSWAPPPQKETSNKNTRTVAPRRTNDTAASHRAAAVSSSCSTEFGQCGGSAWSGPNCCTPPHRCYKQSDWYSQRGSACPEEASWACQAQPPSIGIIVARWGGWPSWMPLFLHTLQHNPTVGVVSAWTWRLFQ